MSPREWLAVREMRYALFALVVALMLCGFYLVPALGTEAVTASSTAVNIVPGALDVPPPQAPVDVSAAVAADIFSPDRTPPEAKYRMPGDPDAAPPAAEEPKPNCLGTAIGSDGESFATCQFQSSRLLMVRVGQQVGKFTVKSIERGRVMFAAPGGKPFEVLAIKPGS